MKINILIALLLNLVFGSLLAQNITIVDQDNPYGQRLPLTNEDFFEQAELIFEGRAIDSAITYDVNNDLLSGEGFYTSVIIEVKHIYRGADKIKKGTIELITKGGTIWVKNEETGWSEKFFNYNSEERVSLGTEHDAVFFCKVSDFPANPKPRKLDNTISVSHIVNRNYAILQIGSIGYGGKDWRTRIRGLNHLNFPNRKAFYQYLKQFKDLKIPSSGGEC